MTFDLLIEGLKFFFLPTSFFVAYLIPSIISDRMKHIEANKIMIINICLGWTIIGWLVSLIMCFMNISKAQDL